MQQVAGCKDERFQKKAAAKGCRGGKGIRRGTVPCKLYSPQRGCFRTAPSSCRELIYFQQRGCSHTASSSCRELMKGRRCRFFVIAEMNLSWQNFHFRILPPFSISPKPSQVSSNLYMQLIPLFQSFSIQSCRPEKPYCSRKCLRQIFFF